jgi:hypothetical protein
LDWAESTIPVGGLFSSRARAAVWEFPLRLKYRLPGRAARRFVAAGYAPRRIAALERPTSVTHGLVTGGGVDLQSG